jgi:hypothetical protein
MPTYPMDDIPPLPGVRQRMLSDINGLSVRVLEAGYETPGRPAVLLVHGFTEIAYSWRNQPMAQSATCSRCSVGTRGGLRILSASVSDTMLRPRSETGMHRPHPYGMWHASDARRNRTPALGLLLNVTSRRPACLRVASAAGVSS